MEGYRVMKAEDAARFADAWVTVTGDCNVIDEPAFKNMRRAIICNSGHSLRDQHEMAARERREGGGELEAAGGVHAARRSAPSPCSPRAPL